MGDKQKKIKGKIDPNDVPDAEKIFGKKGLHEILQRPNVHVVVTANHPNAWNAVEGLIQSLASDVSGQEIAKKMDAVGEAFKKMQPVEEKKQKPKTKKKRSSE